MPVNNTEARKFINQQEEQNREKVEREFPVLIEELRVMGWNTEVFTQRLDWAERDGQSGIGVLEELRMVIEIFKRAEGKLGRLKPLEFNLDPFAALRGLKELDILTSREILILIPQDITPIEREALEKNL